MLLSTPIGCEVGKNIEGLAEALGNPELETIETDGRLLAKGKYRSLRFDGTTADGAFVVAVREGDELVITPFSGEDGCSAGPGRRFVESLSRTNDDEAKLDARIPFLVPATDDEPETLRFTDYACELDEVVVPGGELPLSRDFTNEPGFIVQTEGRELLYVNPWNDEKKKLSAKARTINGSDRAMFASGAGSATWLWMIDDGELAALDRDLDEVFRAGSDVEYVRHSSSGEGGPMLALLDAQGTLFTVLASAPDDIEQIDVDACDVSFGSGRYGRELLYYSPCEERTLRIYELETKTRRTLQSGILRYEVRGSTETGPLLLYVTEPAQSTSVGRLWARWGEKEPIQLGETGNLSMSKLNDDGRAQLVLDWNGSSGRFLVGNLEQELDELDELTGSIAYYGSLGIIADYEDDNGTLYDLVDGQRLEKVAENVSTRGIKFDHQKNRGLFLRNFDGTEGQLTLLEGGKVRNLTKHVRPGSYQFTALLPMVTILTEFDEETKAAKLVMHRTDRDEQIEVADGVAETVEVAWPRKGLLYSAPGAETPGIYFVRAK